METHPEWPSYRIGATKAEDKGGRILCGVWAGRNELSQILGMLSLTEVLESYALGVGVPVTIPPDSCSPRGALSRWLMSWFAEASDDEQDVMVQGVYALRLARNNARDGQRVRKQRR